MTEPSQQAGKNLIILAEKVLSCSPDEKTGENIYRVKWHDNMIPESKMKVMFPDLLDTFKDENEKDKSECDAEEEKEEQKTKKKTITIKKNKGRYSCSECDECFDKHYLYGEHTAKCHPETLKYPCKFCESKFQTDTELNWHMLTHQTSCGGRLQKNRLILPKPTKETKKAVLTFSCKCCKRIFNNKEECDIHMKKTNQAKAAGKAVKALERVKCDLCSKVVTRKRLESHKMVFHFKNGKFPCEHCDKRFLNERDLQRHMSVHDEDTIQAKKYKVECDICGKLLTRIRLENHKLRFHFTEGEFTCKHCGKIFPHLLDLDWHLSNECSRDQTRDLSYS